MSKKKMRPDYGTTFICHSCKDKEFNAEQFLEHLRRDHGFGKNAKLTARMLSHMDGAEWFASVYEITGPKGFSATKTTCQKRHPDDMMRWA